MVNVGADSNQTRSIRPRLRVAQPESPLPAFPFRPDHELKDFAARELLHHSPAAQLEKSPTGLNAVPASRPLLEDDLPARTRDPERPAFDRRNQRPFALEGHSGQDDKLPALVDGIGRHDQFVGPDFVQADLAEPLESPGLDDVFSQEGAEASFRLLGPREKKPQSSREQGYDQKNQHYVAPETHIRHTHL